VRLSNQSISRTTTTMHCSQPLFSNDKVHTLRQQHTASVLITANLYNTRQA